MKKRRFAKIKKRSKRVVFNDLAKQYGIGRSGNDLAIAYAIDHRTWSGLFGGRYEVQGDCFVWQGALNNNGYGLKKLLHHEIKGEFTTVLAHRLSFAFTNGFGSLPRGSSRLALADDVIDHVCNNKACINPKHLRVLTGYENLARSRYQ